jgi:RNA polymerase sigma-70 factor (ECF subfamily)
MMTAANLQIDDRTLQAMKAGDRQAFARFVDAYSGYVYRVALKVLGNPQDAEDVLQNTFIKVFENLHAFESRSALSTWVYRIAVNEALMLLRKQKRLTDAESDSIDDDEHDLEEIKPQSFVDWCCLPEDTLLSNELRGYLDQAVQELPEKLRLVFWLRDVEGLSVRETAQVLDISEAAVKTRLLRARLKLRELLSAYYQPLVEEEQSK